VRRETEWSIDGQLSQEYSYQKLLKSAIVVLQVTIKNVRDVSLETQCITGLANVHWNRLAVL